MSSDLTFKGRCGNCGGKGWNTAGGPDFANLYQEKCEQCDGTGFVVQVAPDNERARWEAAYCIERDKNVNAAKQSSRDLSALAIAQRALAYYAGGPDAARAFTAMEKVRELVGGRASDTRCPIVLAAKALLDAAETTGEMGAPFVIPVAQINELAAAISNEPEVLYPAPDTALRAFEWASSSECAEVQKTESGWRVRRYANSMWFRGETLAAAVDAARTSAIDGWDLPSPDTTRDTIAPSANPAKGS